MHRLDRESVETPACLIAPDPDKEYNRLRGLEKAEVRQALLDIQKNRCAYCERRTGTEADEGHIEHFRDQANHGHMTLDWHNLFWSCNDERTCGKHKDKCNKFQGIRACFDPAEILDPAIDDPDDFFVFVSDGTIQVRDDLDAAQERRAKETLRVFQLGDSAYLRTSRQDAVRPYIGALDAIHTQGAEATRIYVEREIEKLDSAPHATAIRHFLCSYCP